MAGLLQWIEDTQVSAFMREDFYAYFVLLIFHAWGMALLVGGGIAISLRAMGVAGGVRFDRFAALIPWMKAGAVMATISGLGLLAGYPAKALTNWVFALKFACLIAAALLLRQMTRELFPLAASGAPLPGKARWQGAGALALWLAGMAAGKLLLYTNKVLFAAELLP